MPFRALGGPVGQLLAFAAADFLGHPAPAGHPVGGHPLGGHPLGGFAGGHTHLFGGHGQFFGGHTHFLFGGHGQFLGGHTQFLFGGHGQFLGGQAHLFGGHAHFLFSHLPCARQGHPLGQVAGHPAGQPPGQPVRAGVGLANRCFRLALAAWSAAAASL